MSQMEKLYQKVAADSELQAKFAEIMKDAEKVGEEVAKEKLIAFAKEAGYDVTVDEMQEFFKELAKAKEGELSDVEMDQVAGGKSLPGISTIVGSVTSLGISCAQSSLMNTATGGNCSDEYQ